MIFRLKKPLEDRMKMNWHRIKHYLGKLALDFLMDDYKSWKTLMRFLDPGYRPISKRKIGIEMTELDNKHFIKKEQREHN